MQILKLTSEDVSNYLYSIPLASFPGPARSLLVVRNSRRGPGLVHHVMSATVVFLRHQITMFAVLPMYMYNGVSEGCPVFPTGVLGSSLGVLTNPRP